MDKQEFINRISEIGTCEDDAQRRELLAQLSEDASTDYDTLASLTERNATLVNDNEELRSANMKLFKRIGTDRTDANREDESPAPTTKRDFNNLFNEKGDLK